MPKHAYHKHTEAIVICIQVIHCSTLQLSSMSEADTPELQNISINFNRRLSMSSGTLLPMPKNQWHFSSTGVSLKHFNSFTEIYPMYLAFWHFVRRSRFMSANLGYQKPDLTQPIYQLSQQLAYSQKKTKYIMLQTPTHGFAACCVQQQRSAQQIDYYAARVVGHSTTINI